jgi:hypothetical protein
MDSERLPALYFFDSASSEIGLCSYWRLPTLTSSQMLSLSDPIILRL